MSKADDIINNYNINKTKFDNNIKAGLCPICESFLTLKDYSYSYIEKKGLIFKRKKIITIVDKIVICPNGHDIIDPEYGNRNDPSCCCWENTLNKEIRNYHINNYGDGEEHEW